mmetsp:Transcript_21677/g.35476  ORF Transcript_21677/g.35476 Transcript_21677/m.35476 type:complete len:439 (-) Transcript_21677:874-2190(-)
MSLRMALKRSLEDTEGSKKRSAYTPSLTGKKYDDGSSSAAATAPAPAAAATKKTSRRSPSKKSPPIVELVQIEKCIKNNMVSRIEKAGFVEMTQVLPSQFVDSLRSEAEEKLHNLNNHRQKRAADGFIKISNALQAIVSKDLADKVSLALMGSDKIHDSMKHVFGKGGESSSYEGYVVESLKLLATPPGSPPQLPHADDHCTSCLVGILHLKDDQLRTRIAKYNSKKDYPTGITSTCDSCQRDEQLPDEDYKRGVHLTTEKWYCGHCNKPARAYDFEKKLTSAFSELLENPDIADAHAGEIPNANDGILALPTMIHCGPGNPSSSTEHRIVLFFTVRPIYKNTKRLTAGVEKQHKYNEDLQIHAPCILYHQFQKTLRIYERAGCNLRNYSSFIVGANAADLTRLKTDLARARSTIASQEKKIEKLMLRLGEDESDASS